MRIELQKAGKKYFREWVFRNVNTVIEPSDKIAITGPNGSGKSTFLQVFSGALLPTEGSILYSHEGNSIEDEKVFRHVSIAAPYLELIEEFTLDEIVSFHYSFKKPVGTMTVEEVISLSGLESSRKKTFKYFSSGMKQRLKISLAVLSDSQLILLDEPCSNFDADAIKWYQSLIRDYAKEKTVVVCSNNLQYEFEFCNRQLNMMDLK